MIRVPEVPEVWDKPVIIPQELYIISKTDEYLSPWVLDKNGEWLETYGRGDSGWNDCMFFESIDEAREVLENLEDSDAYILPATEAWGLGSVEVKNSAKLDIPFEEQWLYEDTLKYPIDFKVDFRKNLEVYGVKKDDGTIGVTTYNSPVFDTIGELINYTMQGIKDEYGEISDIKIGNPEILEE